jgi:asparagine synthase (glutamine-hydrolysing)
LVKVDRASMACSLEVRSPFLDHELVEFVNQVPMDLKLKGLTTKYLLKKVAAKYLPARIVNRKKKGFAMPIARWFRRELKGPLTDYLSPTRLAAQGYFNPAYVEGLVREHLEGKANHYKKLWTLLVFELWQEKWLESYQQNDHAIDHVAALRLHQVG